MGTWGTGILDDDLARDVYDAYLAAAAQGRTPAAIVELLRATHAGELTDPAQDAVFCWPSLTRSVTSARRSATSTIASSTSCGREWASNRGWRLAPPTLGAARPC